MGEQPPETAWRELRVRPPAPSGAEPVFSNADPALWEDEELPPLEAPWPSGAGRDAQLTALVARLSSTEWYRECTGKPDGKARFWELVATHFACSPLECQRRWRSLSLA